MKAKSGVYAHCSNRWAHATYCCLYVVVLSALDACALSIRVQTDVDHTAQLRNFRPSRSARCRSAPPLYLPYGKADSHSNEIIFICQQ